MNREALDEFFATADDVLTDWESSPDSMHVVDGEVVLELDLEFDSFVQIMSACATSSERVAAGLRNQMEAWRGSAPTVSELLRERREQLVRDMLRVRLECQSRPSSLVLFHRTLNTGNPPAKRRPDR